MCRDVGLGQNAQVEGDFQRSADLENFWAHWRYNLEDPGCKCFPLSFSGVVLCCPACPFLFLRRGHVHRNNYLLLFRFALFCVSFL